jgi:hypothetical protein
MAMTHGEIRKKFFEMVGKFNPVLKFGLEQMFAAALQSGARA